MAKKKEKDTSIGFKIEMTIEEHTHAKAVAIFADLMKDGNIESMRVGCHIILNDELILEGVNDSIEFTEAILTEAELKDEYAGMEYVPEAFLEPDDPDFVPEDEGLSWTSWNEVWEALVKMAEILKAE